MHESTRGYMFDIGDTVKVISPKLKTHFKTGIVIDRFIDKSNCRKYQIRIDDVQCFIYSENNLTKDLSAIDEYVETTEVKADSHSRIKPDVACIKFYKDNSGGLSNISYSYLIDSNDISIGDNVICDTKFGLRIGEVQNILDYETAHEDFPYYISKYVIGKVNLTEHGKLIYHY